MTLINEEVQKIIEKVLEIIKKQYEGYEIKITGIHIEKILGENEYVVTANFNFSYSSFATSIKSWYTIYLPST